MTIEKAEQILKELWRYGHTDKYTNEEIREALDIGLNALRILYLLERNMMKVNEGDTDGICEQVVRGIHALQSVTPKPFINKPCVSEQVCHEDKIKVLDKLRAEIIDTLYVDSLIFGELIDFKNGKISADDVIEEFNRVTRLEVLKVINKYKTESEE